MNTKLTIAFVVVIVAGLLLFVAWRAPQKDADPVTDNSENTEEQLEGNMSDNGLVSSPTTGTASFAYLMGLGQDLKCDIQYEPQSGTSVIATVYLSNGHMRTDSEMMMGGEVYQSHMIYDGDMIYTWNTSSVSDLAIKFKVDEGAMTGDSTDDVSGRPVNLDQKVDYDCEPWTVEGGSFAPPSDIEFMDMENMMRGGAGFNGNIEVQ